MLQRLHLISLVLQNTAQKMKFSNKDFFSKCDQTTPWYIYHTLNDDLLTTFYSRKIKIAKSCEKTKFLVKIYFHKASAKEFTFSEVKKLLTMFT